MEFKVPKEQLLRNVIKSTDFNQLGSKYQGKVRDCYSNTETGEMYIITSDRLSCFDRIISTVPLKGQILTAMAVETFEQTKEIFPNHLISQPDPNVMLVKPCKIIPIEVIVRAYLTGSAWRDYQAGKAISGITLPAGLKMSHKFEQLILTPSTKAEMGEHDQPVSEQEIIEQKIVSEDVWQQVKAGALALFEFGAEQASKNGLILVDTKYEFGIDEKGNVILADEVHTLDCSRYWYADSYKQAYQDGINPKMLDKENVRSWLMQRGFSGDGEVPKIDDDYRLSVTELYLDSYQKITGKDFDYDTTEPLSRIKNNLGIK